MVNFDKTLCLNDILNLVQGYRTFLGEKSELSISNITLRGEENQFTLDWCGKKNSNEVKEYLTSSKAGLVLVNRNNGNHGIEQGEFNVNILFVQNPKLEFARIVNHAKGFSSLDSGKSFNSALIHHEANVGRNVIIGAGVQIGKAIVGDNCRIGANTVILDNVHLGDNVVIGSCSVIGGEGYGYVNDYDNSLIKFPHIGGVRIGANVDIGSNVAIDRGSLMDTIILDGVKIDNLVHIAHNVSVGRDSHIIANAMIAGSVKIGERVWIAPSSNILEHLTIGDDAKIGVGSVVTKNVPQGQTWAGAPAKELSEFLKIQHKIKSL